MKLNSTGTQKIPKKTTIPYTYKLITRFNANKKLDFEIITLKVVVYDSV